MYIGIHPTLTLLVMVSLSILPTAAFDSKVATIVRQADDAKQQGQLDKALEFYGSAWSKCSPFEQTKCDAADILRSQARCYVQLKSLKQAETALRKAVFIYELNQRPDINTNIKAILPHYYEEDYYAPQCAAVLYELADVLTQSGKKDEANEIVVLANKLNRKSGDPADAVAAWKKKFQEAVPDTRTTAWSDKADEKFKQLLETGKTFEPGSARLATSWWGFSNWYVTRSKFKEAEQACANALGVAEQTFGPANPAIGDLLCHYANVCRKAKSYAKSDELYKRALTIYTKQLPDTDSNVAAILTSMQDLLRDQGLGQGQRAIEIQQRIAPDTSQSVAQTKKVADQNRDLLALYMTNGKYDQAEQSLKKAMEFEQTTNGRVSLKDMVTLADIKCKLKKFAEAEALYKAARDRCANERLRQYDEILEKYAEMLKQCDRVAEAEDLEAEARQFRIDGKKKLYH